jgi:hypothetical protein
MYRKEGSTPPHATATAGDDRPPLCNRYIRQFMDCSASNTLALQRFDLKHLPPEALLLTAITRLDLSDNYLSVLPPVITRLQVSPRPGEALRSRGGSMSRGPRLFQQS